jgi:hypothetical protein
MRCAFEARAPLQSGADMTRATPEKQPAGPECGGRADLASAARPAVAPYQISIEQFLPIQRWMLGVGRFFSCYDLGGSLFLINDVKRSIGRGKKVVVLCSLEISRIVCRKRSCSAIGSLLIIAAACTIFSAA